MKAAERHPGAESVCRRWNVVATQLV